ncbi:hypothetical protein [Chryseobacterium sp.]|uniref:hypothetical protein n=1 Tax=Chryseobacterium sp. TaxID=1871047 RepID=UPI003219EA3A
MEIWKLYPRFDFTYFLIGDPNQGDIVTIYNKSNKSVVIKYFSIEKNNKNISLGNEADFNIIAIKSHDYFNIRNK